MYDVAVCTDSFADPETVPYGERTLACLLWALIFADQSYLISQDRKALQDRRMGRAVDPVPLLYNAGVVWKREEPQHRTACPEGEGQELFLGVRQVINQGHADCEDVACWRVAELRLGRSLDKRPRMPPNKGHPRPTVLPLPYPMQPAGPAVLPAFFKRQTGPSAWTYHIVVWWPDGTFEDPSRVLGMGAGVPDDLYG